MVPALNLNRMLLCFWRHGFATKTTKKRCSKRNYGKPIMGMQNNPAI